jgi:perosamine synthetase
VKHVTTGEGGMLATSNERTAKFARTFRNHGMHREIVSGERYGAHTPWLYDVKLLGWNYRLNEISSALGLSQLQRLDTGISKRSAIARFYTHEFKELQQVRVPHVPENVKHAWHLYTVILKEKELKVGRERFVEALRAENIGAAVHYPPAHLFSFHREKLGYKEGDFPVAEAVARNIVSLPLFPSMTREDCEDVVEAVKKIADYYSK